MYGFLFLPVYDLNSEQARKYPRFVPDSKKYLMYKSVNIYHIKHPFKTSQECETALTTHN